MLTILVVGFFGVRLLNGIGYVFAQYSGVLAGIAVLVISIYKIYKKDNPLKKEIPKLNRTEIKPFAAMGFSLMVSNFFSGMMPINETFLVNNIIQDEIISANFKVAGLLPAQLLLVSSAIVVYYFPIIARKQANNETWKQIKTIGLVTFCVVMIVASLGAFFTPWIIKYVYGEKYSDATSISYVLWSGIRSYDISTDVYQQKYKYNILFTQNVNASFVTD